MQTTPRTRRRAGLALAIVSLLVLGACRANVERSIDWVNTTRAADGRGGLVEDATLKAKAQAHAERLAEAGRLWHSDLGQGVPPNYSLVGENVAMGPTLDAAHDALWNSPSHRSTMLDGRFSRVGVGYSRVGGTTYVVHVFWG